MLSVCCEWRFSHKCYNGAVIEGVAKLNTLVGNILSRNVTMLVPKACVSACALAMVMDRLPLNRTFVPFLKCATLTNDVEIKAIGYPNLIESMPTVKDIFVDGALRRCIMIANVLENIWFVQKVNCKGVGYSTRYKCSDLRMVDITSTRGDLTEENALFSSVNDQVAIDFDAQVPKSLHDINDDTGMRHRGLRDIFAMSRTKAEMERARLDGHTFTLDSLCWGIERDPFNWPNSSASWRKRLVIVWQELEFGEAIRWHISMSTLPSMIKMCHRHDAVDKRE